MKKIAIVEDDVYIGNMLAELLSENGYNYERAYSGSEAILLVQSYKPDLILLDLMLPGLSGEEVIDRIKNLNIPIIVMSAKTMILDKVNNLINGASDYITKPFDNFELLARIQAQLRRVNFGNSEIIRIKQLQINDSTHTVTISDKALKLTKSEYGILLLLCKNPNKVFSKSAISESLWGYGEEGEESSVNVHISNLRTKIKEITEYNYIETIWGVGFKINN